MMGGARRYLMQRASVALVCAMSLLPLRALATLDTARQLASDGHVDKALAHVDEILHARPQSIAARLLRGVLLSRNGQSDAAIDAFLSVAEDRPDLPEPHNNLAVLYAAQGRYDEARGALKRAIGLQPDYDVAHENLGDVYVKLASLAYARAQRINEGNRRVAQKALATAQFLHASPQSGAQTTSTQARAQPPEPVATTPEPRPVPTTSRAVSRASSAALPAAHLPAPAAVTAPLLRCVRILAITPTSRASDMLRWLRAHGMQATITQTDSSVSATRRYQVLLPPQGSPAGAQTRQKELLAKGVEDLIVIAHGEHAGGISLGVFKERAGAERRRSAVAQKGAQAQIIEINTRRRRGTAQVQARGPFIEAAFAREFADTSFNINDCR